jgi:rare lipoprotein A
MNLSKILVLVMGFIAMTQCKKTDQQADSETAGKGDRQAIGWKQSGMASWYGPDFQGKPTANGETFNTNELTAAHKTLFLPEKKGRDGWDGEFTYVKVTNQTNNRSVVVRVNDRGPYVSGRIIDLSKAAMQAIGGMQLGHVPVVIEVVPKPGTSHNTAGAGNSKKEGCSLYANANPETKLLTIQARINGSTKACAASATVKDVGGQERHVTLNPQDGRGSVSLDGFSGDKVTVTLVNPVHATRSIEESVSGLANTTTPPQTEEVPNDPSELKPNLPPSEEFTP